MYQGSIMQCVSQTHKVQTQMDIQKEGGKESTLGFAGQTCIWNNESNKWQRQNKGYPQVQNQGCQNYDNIEK